MPVGPSGRIVVEIDPELKRGLHARLQDERRDFESWLLERIHDYLGSSQDTEQPPPDLSEPERRVLEAVSSRVPAPCHVDDLVHATELRVPGILDALLRLELRGLVVQQVGLYRLKR